MTDKSLLYGSDLFPDANASEENDVSGSSPDQNADPSGRPVTGEPKREKPVQKTHTGQIQVPVTQADNPKNNANGQGAPLYDHTSHGNTAPRQQSPASANPYSQGQANPYSQGQGSANPYSQGQTPRQQNQTAQRAFPQAQPVQIPRQQTPPQTQQPQQPQTQQSPPPPPRTQAPLSNEAVTSHTASLWKYLPIPQDRPEPYDEYIRGTVNFKGSNIIAARVRGKKHKHEGTNCDDWFEVACLDKVTFVAVSDGAGSKVFSRIGAKVSCQAAIEYLTKEFKTAYTDNRSLQKHVALSLQDPKCMDACGKLAGIVQQSVIEAYNAVEAAYEARKDDPAYQKVLGREPEFKDFSGTLLIAVLIPVKKSTKEHLVITCQIGDGMIAILNSKGDFAKSVKLMGKPDSGDFSGQTDFLTSEKMKNLATLQNRTMITRSVVDTVMVMSDGVADDYFPNETQMHRLYFDLIINGILDRIQDIKLSKIPAEQITLLKRLPDPVVYPWVNDQNVKVPIQYTSRILEKMGLRLENLWDDPTILAWARQEVVRAGASTDPSERLKTWLDNYVERGSFDDRTLVIVTM